MKTARKVVGSLNSEKLKVKNKTQRSASKSNGKPATKRRKQPSDIKFGDIIEKINEGFVALDSEMNYLYLNKRGCELLQRKPEDLIGKNYWDEYPLDKDTSFGQAYLRALETQTPIELEDYYAPRAMWFENRIYPSEAGLSIFFNDVTERKQTDEKLQRQADALKWAHVLMRDINNCITSWDKGVEQLYGWTKEEALGKNSHELFQTEFPVSFEDYQEKLFTIGEWQGTLKHIKRDGSQVLVASHQVIQSDAVGNPIAILEVNNDITEQKRAEELLRTEREVFRRLFDTMPVMVSMYDPETNSAQLNAELERLSGWKTEEVTVVSLLQSLYPDPEYLKEVLGRMAAAVGKNEWVEVQVQARDGRKIDSLWSNISLMNGEQIIRGVALGIDITERKQAERTLSEFARKQEALYQLTDQLQRANSFAETYNAALNAITSALQCDRAAILLSDDAEVMHFAAWHGLSDEYRKFTDGHSPWQPDTKNPEPVYYNETDSSDLSDSLKAVIKAEGISSLAFIPLVSGEKLIGKFMTYFNAPHHFNEAEIELSLTIARQLTFGIERQRAEEKLRTSEDRLRLAVEAGYIGIWDIDLVRHDRTWSKEGKAIYGLKEDEFLDFERQLALTHPDDHAYVDQMVRAFRDEGAIKQLNLEHRLIHPDGSVHWVEVHGEAIYADKPLPIRLVGTIVDITERKESERRLILLTSISELLRKLEDPDELMYAVSKAVGEHLQVKRCLFNEIDVANDIEIVHRDYCRGVPSVAGVHKVTDYSSVTTAEIASGKTIVNTDSKTDVRTASDYERSYAPNGERAYVAVPMMREGQWVASLWVSDNTPRQWSREDVSLLESIAERTWTAIERVRREQALNETEERFSKAFHFSPALKLIIQANTGQIVDINDASVELFEHTRAKAIGKVVTDVIQLAEEKMRSTLAAQMQAEGHLRNMEIVVRTQSGKLHSLIFNAESITLHGEPHYLYTMMDITERKEAEKALHASEALYRTIARNIPNGGVYVVDQDMRYLVAEGSATELFSLSREQLEGHTVSEIFTKEQSVRLEENLSLAFAGQTASSETQRNGHVYWSQYAPLNDSIGRAIIVTIDITERKQMEEELRQSEERERLRAAQLEAIMEAVPAAIWIAHDSECRLVTGNRASYEILRMPAGENASLSAPDGLVPTNFKVLHNGQVMRNEELPVQRAARGEEVHDFEEEVRFDDGRSVYLFGSAVTFRDEQNQPIGALAAFVDITARKQAEEELRLLNIELEERVMMRTAELRATNERLLEEIEERAMIEEALRESNETSLQMNKQLSEEIEERAMVEEALRESDETTRLILDTSPDVIVIANHRGQIMRVNAQIKNLFGYESNEVLGKPIESLIPQRFHERYVEHRSDYSTSPHRRPMGIGMELSGQRKNKSEFPVDVMLTPIHNISNWETMVTIRDITERKKMEDELHENQKRLQTLSQRLVEVQEEERRAIARELHDRVGQSLAALSLNLSIVSNQLSDQANAQVNERLSDSIHLVKEVIALVRDVMANLRPAVLDDYGLEVALQGHLEAFTSRYGIAVSYEKSDPPLPRLNPSVEMTFLRIAQEALLNIVRHAHADHAVLSLQWNNQMVHLNIEDNGTGIQSWQEANRAGSHGLTIMRERAEAVGGSLKVSSESGKGTNIDVRIPFQLGIKKEK